MKGLKVDLLVIDPQNDFCDIPGAALPVPGAAADMTRLAAFISNVGFKLNDIHVTMDSHHPIDIAHPTWFRRAKDELVNGIVQHAGSHPAPFTVILPAHMDPANPTWVGNSPALTKRTIDYVNALYAKGRYPLVVWPEHCLIGTWGHNVFEPVSLALREWERTNFGVVDYVTKGSNVFTEHYSAVAAEIPDPDDPSTMLNSTLINLLANCDQVVIAGEALSHCVANTVRDIAAQFGDDNVKKLVLLEDCMSNVTTFEKLGSDFIRDMKAKGMQLAKSTEFMQTRSKVTATA